MVVVLLIPSGVDADAAFDARSTTEIDFFVEVALMVTSA